MGIVLGGVGGVHGSEGAREAGLSAPLVPSEQRATVVSFDSMMGSGGGVLSQGGLGFLARSHSIAQG